MNRRISTLLVALAPIVAFGVLLALVTVPYVSLGPGPTFDTLGEVEGKEVVEIEGTEVQPTTGHLNMTTVSQRDNLTLGQALTLWMSGREQLVPRDLVYPPDRSKDEIDEANNQEFKRSEDSAEYAALGYLKYAPAVTVETVSKDGASKGKLNEGDAIEGVNGVPVTSLDQFQSIMGKTKPDQEVVLDFRRKKRRPASRRSSLAPTRTSHRVPGYRGGRSPVGAVHHRLQPGQHRRPVRRTCVQPGRHRQADHGGTERIEVRRGHRHHRRRRQSRLHRRHHAQDSGRA